MICMVCKSQSGVLFKICECCYIHACCFKNKHNDRCNRCNKIFSIQYDNFTYKSDHKWWDINKIIILCAIPCIILFLKM